MKENISDLEILVWLNKYAAIAGIRLKRLLDYFGNLKGIVNAPQERLSLIAGIGQETAARIRSFKIEDAQKELIQARKLGLDIIVLGDAGYPENLKKIPDPPIVLYVKGRLEELDKFALAIVGSRRASYYGISCAGMFARELAAKGFTVVSGMARGIDTASHRGALVAGGRTIAVIGSGFRQVYPPENRELAEEIARNGAVISEFALDEKPLKQNFPRRNRVISGLSLGVLVAEAAKNSGALITADFALEQGREVFALPGKIDSFGSFGTNNLIKQGAKLVLGIDDILEELAFSIDRTKQDKTQPKNEIIANLSAEESSVLACVSKEPIFLDELVGKLGMDIPEISAILLKLRLQKLVIEISGKKFIRSENEKESGYC